MPADDFSAKPWLFLKEISSNGNLNTMDVMFQTWPGLITLNPEYVRLFLEPILWYLNLPKGETWPQPWVIHDMGTRKSSTSFYST